MIVTNLAADTETGAKYILSQAHTVVRICGVMKCEFGGFGDKAAHADYILFKEGLCKAVVEVKSRELELAQSGKLYDPVKDRHYDTYMISNSKLLYGEDMARRTGVPFFIFARLMRGNDDIVYWKVFDEYGKPNFDYEVSHTRSQATCEGKEDAFRDNAFLPLEYMKLLTEDQDGIKKPRRSDEQSHEQG